MVSFLIEVLAVVLGVFLAYWIEKIFHLTIPGGLYGSIGYVVICVFLARAVLGLALSVDYSTVWRRTRPNNP